MHTRIALFAVGAAASLLLPVSAASAATTSYATRALFNAANPGLPTETFEAADLPSGSSLSYNGTLSDTSNNAIFATGSVLSGFVLTTTNAAGLLQPNGSVYVGNNFGGNSTKVVSSNVFSDNINVTFGPSISALAFDLDGFNNVNGPWIVNLLSGNSTIATFNLATGGFFGVASTVAFDGLYLDKPNSGGVIDNLSFGIAGRVPEPGTWALMIVGFAAVGAAARRRSHLQALLS